MSFTHTPCGALHMVQGMARQRGLDELDHKILEALKEAGQPLRPKEIAERIGEDARRIAAKMRKLVRLGLVERLEDGRYQITEAGKEAAAGGM